MKLQLEHISPNLKKEDFINIEKELGLKIPVELVHFYILNNGGIPNKQYYYCEETESYVKIKKFIPFHYVDNNWNIEMIYKKFCINNKFIKSNYLPFGWDEGDNLFCINVNTKYVYLIYLDIGEIDEDEYIYLSSDFKDFISQLQIEELYDESE